MRADLPLEAGASPLLNEPVETNASFPLRLPFVDWADEQISALRILAPDGRWHGIDGAGLLGMRAHLNQLRWPASVSAGGGCRIHATTDGHVAINLSRREDQELLPALFAMAETKTGFPGAKEAVLVHHGRTLGLAIAGVHEGLRCESWTPGVKGNARQRHAPPMVIDLSALWAGPLAGHLFWRAGARVIKVESRSRPDSLRQGDAALFAQLNQGKANIAIDLRDSEDRAALVRLIEQADLVIEAARPRALAQIGIDADVLVRRVPGLVWLSITGHGVRGDAADWIGFGDDTAVAAGASAAIEAATGFPGFLGDAAGDPLTGLYAARCGLAALNSGRAQRLFFSMRGIVAEALAHERRLPAAFEARLRVWAAAAGTRFPAVDVSGCQPVSGLGQDNAAWLSC